VTLIAKQLNSVKKQPASGKRMWRGGQGKATNRGKGRGVKGERGRPGLHPFLFII